MAHANCETSSEIDRRWLKRKSPSMGMPGWAGVLIVALGLALLATLGWQGGKYVFNRLNGSSGGKIGAAEGAVASLSSHLRGRAPEWQNDVHEAFRDGVADSTAGNLDGAEMDVDRGAEILTEARSRHLTAPPEFFDLALRTLDQAVQAHPDNDRLIEHTTLARVELAQMRTLAPGRAEDEPVAAAPAGGTEQKAALFVPGGGNAALSAKVVPVYAPVSIAANTTYDAARAHGNLLDATMMAGEAEILLPPSSRLSTDGVRVRGLTLKGASQTLDGIYWENVTFVGTRLRYDGGEISLHNVRFVDCTFGMPPNERGAHLATAIALGESSIVIE